MSINPFIDYPLSWRPDKRQLKRPYAVNLVKKMKADIKAGRLLPETKLPPQRELADFLDLGFSTITRVYKMSQEQGLTFGRVGQGTFVAGHADSPLTITRKNASAVLDLGFIASFESTNSLVKSTIRDVAKEATITRLLNYDSPTGLKHQKIIATRYLNQVGMTVNTQNTVITSGGESALNITLASLFNNGDRIAVDQFTYANFIDMARLAGIKLVPIEDDHDGMIPARLSLACQQQHLAGIYLMPDCNNPTTITIPAERQRELAEVIRTNHLLLIEDDYLSFLNLYRSHPLVRMSELVPDQSVYIASLSKPLVSGLRVAFVRPADQYLEQFDRTMFTLNVKTSSLDVEVVTKLLENGQAEKIMQKKMELMRQNTVVFDQVFQTPAHRPAFFLPLPLRSQESGKVIEEYLLANGLRVFHSDRFLTGSQGQQNFLRVSLAAIDDPGRLREALLKLNELLRARSWL